MKDFWKGAVIFISLLFILALCTSIVRAQTVTNSSIYGVGVTYLPGGSFRLLPVYAPVPNDVCETEQSRLQTYFQQQEIESYNTLYGITPTPISRAFCVVQTNTITPPPGTGGAPCQFDPSEWDPSLSIGENLTAKCVQ